MTDTNGRVFVRLTNGQSFAFPAEDLPFLRGRPGWPDEASADPDQPVGRPLHPITSQSLVVAYEPVTPRTLPNRRFGAGCPKCRS